MLRLLVATDGSENALRAVGHVAALARRGLRIEAELLHVRAPVLSGEVGVIAPVDITERKHGAAAHEAFAAARPLLAEAGVPVEEHEAEGDAADEIVAAAARLGCDGIVLGHRGRGRLATLVAGSVCARVARRSALPVTVVQ